MSEGRRGGFWGLAGLVGGCEGLWLYDWVDLSLPAPDCRVEQVSEKAHALQCLGEQRWPCFSKKLRASPDWPQL